MNKKFLKEADHTFIVLMLIMIAMISLLVLWNISKLTSIYIVGDEFGYWANVAYFTGLDWSDVAAYNTYYSFGLSLLLVPLMKIFHEPSLMYQAAIVMNNIFLVLSFLLAFTCGKMIFAKMNKYVLLMTAFAITLYSNNVFQSQNTQTETLLYFMFWIVFYLLIKFWKEPKFSYSILCAIALGYIYSVHMRSLGVCIAAVLSILFFSVLERKYLKYAVSLLAVFAIVMVGVNLVKGNIIDDLYSNNAMVALNDYSGQVDKLKSIFSLKGIYILLRSFIGKTFYLGITTFTLFFWAVKRGCRILFGAVKKFKIPNEKPSLEEKILFFSILAILGTLAVSSIYMKDVFRLDTLIYGRYNEFILGPVLLLGFAEFMEERKHEKFQFIFISVLLVMGVYCAKVLSNVETTDYVAANVAGIANLAHKDGKYSYQGFLIIASLRAVVVSVLGVILVRYGKKNRLRCYVLLAAAVSCVWVFSGLRLSYDQTFIYRENYATDEKIAEIIKGSESRNIYYVVGDSNIKTLNTNPDFIQFLLPYDKINIIGSKQLAHVKDADFIIFNKDEYIENLSMENYRFTEESFHYLLYTRQ